jgi:hypothetical protein
MCKMHGRFFVHVALSRGCWRYLKIETCRKELTHNLLALLLLSYPFEFGTIFHHNM